jgi:uncharacterized protein (TIGR00297 family)
METPRQLLHLVVGLFALLLPWLTWPQAALLAAGAVAFNLIVLPRIAPRVFRDSDQSRRWSSGIVLYPFAVLGLILVFRSQLHLAATAWAILAAGDGMATLVGVNVRSTRLPWNRHKSVAGLAAFILFGTAAALGTMWWTSPRAPDAWMFAAAAIAAIVAGFAETAPISLDDNLTVPVMAAAVLGTTGAMSPALLSGQVTSLDVNTWALLGLNAAVAVLGWAARTVTPAGAMTGMIIGALIIIGTGLAGWVVLIVTFVAASLTTRLGHARKAKAGIAEDRGGRRGPGNAIGNTGVAAWAALVAAGSADPSLPHLALVAALVTAGSDTVASEVGKSYGRTTWLITSFQRVPAGTTGAISLEGTLGGIASAALLSLAGAWMALIPMSAVPLVVAASTVASLIEGVIGATIEARGMLTNDVVNFVNSALGAGLAILIRASL